MDQAKKIAIGQYIQYLRKEKTDLNQTDFGIEVFGYHPKKERNNAQQRVKRLEKNGQLPIGREWDIISKILETPIGTLQNPPNTPQPNGGTDMDRKIELLVNHLSSELNRVSNELRECKAELRDLRQNPQGGAIRLSRSEKKV